MANSGNPEQEVTELLAQSMRKEGWDPRQIANALKLWRTFYRKLGKNLHRPELWAAAVELAVARLELEDQQVQSRIARKYGVKPSEVTARCDEIMQRLNIQPFDPRFCSMPQMLADMILEDSELQEQLGKLASHAKKQKAAKQPPPPPPGGSETAPPLDQFVGALIANPKTAYREVEHIADVALDWRDMHGFDSARNLLTQLINHFGSQPQNGINVEITADALVALGELLRDEKRFSEAIPLFRRAADIHGNYPGALDDLAEAQFALGQFVEAIATWREELRHDPQATHSYHRIADCYARLGQTAGTVATLEELLRVRPRDIQAHDRLRAHWLQQGRKDRADYHRSCILRVRAPKGLDDVTVWAQYQIEAGRPDPVMRVLNRLEEELGDRVEIRVNLLRAILFLVRGKEEEAQHEVRRVRAIPNLCEHCWNNELELLAKRFGSELIEQIRRLAEIL